MPFGRLNGRGSKINIGQDMMFIKSHVQDVHKLTKIINLTPESKYGGLITISRKPKPKV
jgi:hypothetical protein